MAVRRFWGSSKNKSNLQILSREHFIDKSKESCIKIRNSVASAKHDLDYSLEEADCCIILHVADASDRGCKRILITSDDSDVVIYALSYFGSFNVEEFCVRFWVE